MASGSFNVSCDNSSITVVCNWRSTPNSAGNFSNVYAEIRASRKNPGNAICGNGSGVILIDQHGTGFAIRSDQTITYNSNTLLGSSSWISYHNDDGTGTVAFTIYGNFSSTEKIGTTKVICNLDKIPRFSVVSLSPDTCTMRDGSIKISTNRRSNQFTHEVHYYYYSHDVVIANNVTDSCTWTPPIDLARILPYAASGCGKIYINTYDKDGNYLGQSEQTFTLNVPSDIIPAANLKLTPLNSLNGSYIQNNSSVKIETLFCGTFGSTATSYEVTVTNGTHSTNYTGSSVIASLPYQGTYTIKARVKDSRDRYSNYVSSSITVLPYSDPYFKSFSAFRSDSSGNASDIGTCLHWSADASISPCKNGTADLNTHSYTLKYKKTTDTEYIRIPVSSGFEFSSSGTISGLSTDYSYDVQFIVSDKYKTLSKIATIPSSYATMDILNNGKGVAFGKISNTTNLFDVGFPARMRKTLQMDGEITSDGINQKYARAFKSISGYPGITQNDGTDTGWLRTTSYGILPYTSGGSGSCGTSSWPFSGIYGTHIYQCGSQVWSANTLPVQYGNWTPSGSNLSLSTSTSRYRRTGNLVTVSYTGYISPNGTSNQAGIAGLPFTPAAYASNGVGYSRLVFFINGNSNTPSTSLSIGADTDGYIRFLGVIGGRTWILCADELNKNGGDGWISFSLTYEI